MMSVEQQAKALADWLANNPGAQPPEGVDSDVIEAVYMLRPDLAPAPRVSIDDILGLVSVGPLAAPVAAPGSAPVAAPVTPVVGQEPPLAADVAVSSVPDAIITPTPANNNRRLWAVLGGMAALAAAVLVTVQVSMTANQGSFAPQSSVTAADEASPMAPTPAPALAQAPARDQPAGAARQQDKIDGGTVVTEQPVALDGDDLWDAVADLGELAEPEEELDFEFNNDGDLAGLLQEQSDRDSRFDEGTEGLPSGGLGRNQGMRAANDAATGADIADFSSRGVVGGETAGFGAGALDANELELAAAPMARPAPSPAAGPSPVASAAREPSPEPVRATTATATASAPPPPAVVAPEPEPETLDLGWGDDFLDAAVADAEESSDEDQFDEREEVQTRSFDDVSVAVEVDEVVAEVTRSRPSRTRDRGRRRDERSGAHPSVDVPQEAQPSTVQHAPPADAEPAVESRFSTTQVGVDAGVIQAQERARALASRQQYGSAFDTLSGYISPSAPIDVVLDATEYAFAAGRWSDTVRVASIRLNANVPSDSPQSRSRLYDFRARAQAMLDQRMSAPTMMSDEP